jgi:hypothetical protein
MKWVVECPWTFTNSVSVATKRVFKNLQQGRSGGGTGYRGDNTSQKSQKTQCNFNLETFFENRFLKWEFEQINFVVGNRGSVVESDL